MNTKKMVAMIAAVVVVAFLSTDEVENQGARSRASSSTR